MASLTPGVLSKLLENNDKAKVTSSSHRSPLLQVIEIVPSLSDQLWRSDGFFLKVSDSLHAAYVAVSAGDDADLIRSDQIRIGQLVYVQGGVHFDSGFPVPVMRGLKPVPKRRPCLGNPRDLISSDVLVPLVGVFGKPKSSNGKGKTKKKEGEVVRRLSLDSARRAWDNTPPSLSRRSSPRLKSNSKPASGKDESPSKHSAFGTSPLKNNSVISPKLVDKPLKKNVKSLSKEVVPKPLVKLPLSLKFSPDQKILWNALPSMTHELGKDALSHRNVAFSAAVCALEEASATEAVLHCLQKFGELCESSQKLSAGSLVQQFLDVHLRIQRAAAVVHLLNTRSPDSISSTLSSADNQNLSWDKLRSNKNAASWVQAAIGTDLSKFNLFKEAGKDETHGSKRHYYVVIENPREESNSDNHLSKSKTSPKNPANKDVPSPLAKHLSGASKIKSVKNKWSSGSGLKYTANLAEKLLLISRQWFLKYLEDSLNKGFTQIRGEGAAEIACLLGQLKRVNQWLDDLVGKGMETDEKIEDLRKKLYRFLLEHVNSSLAAT